MTLFHADVTALFEPATLHQQIAQFYRDATTRCTGMGSWPSKISATGAPSRTERLCEITSAKSSSQAIRTIGRTAYVWVNDHAK